MTPWIKIKICVQKFLIFVKYLKCAYKFNNFLLLLFIEKISRVLLKKNRGFSKFLKSNFTRGKFLKIQSSINLPSGHARSHKKFGRFKFSRFDVYWLTSKQTDKQSIYIDKCKGTGSLIYSDPSCKDGMTTPDLLCSINFVEDYVDFLGLKLSFFL